MTRARTVHVVVPAGYDDPSLPSGGNTYDRRLCEELAGAGWSVCIRALPGDWPWAGVLARGVLAEALAAVPERSVVLVDGMVASAVPEIVVPASRRLRIVVLMHQPLGSTAEGDRSQASEAGVVASASAVVATSDWSRQWLLAAYSLDSRHVHVAHPGVDIAAPALGSADGDNLLCVGAVTPGKGHDVLLAALTRTTDLRWRCVCVGALTKAPDFVAELRSGIRTAGLDDRLVLTGPRTGPELETSYAEADVLVLASRAETYGMVVTEALARSLPVLATEVGGVPEALGATPDGRPGLLSPPGDVDALAESLRRWLSDPPLRHALRGVALQRRATLTGWAETADLVARVLVQVAS